MGSFSFLAACIVLAGLISVSTAVEMESWGRYLDGNRGPYRGRVVDAQTKKQLVGAVVVVYWRRDIPAFIQTNSIHYKAREVLTDKNGEFLINVEDVEKYAPPLTQRPEFVIFLPGYGAFPWFQTVPTGFIGGYFEGNGGTVELSLLKNRAERLKNQANLYPNGLSDDPFKEIPEFMRLVNLESVSLGLHPYSDTRKTK
jgi:hypothetical protein